MKYRVLILFMITLHWGSAQYDKWDDFESSDSTQEEEKVEYVTNFNDTRIINGHSTAMFDKGTFDFRVGHRFGNIATQASARTLFGLDQSADIRIAFEYNILKQLQIGLGRSKGYSPYSELWDGFIKYVPFQQSNKFPLSIGAVGSVFFTSMLPSTDSTSMLNFRKPSHRFSYYTQIMISRNFFNYVTLQFSPGIMYRNFVAYEDQNLLFSLGTMIKVKIWKKLSIIGEYNFVFRENKTILGREYVNPLAFAVEYKTFKHSFQINFMNSGGIVEGQYIPYTVSKWLEGQFRLGFTISRQF